MSDESVSSNIFSGAFSATVLVTSGFAAGICAANAIDFNNIRHGAIDQSITVSKAHLMFWLNVILSVIFVVLFIWAIFKMVKIGEFKRIITEIVEESPRITLEQPSKHKYISGYPYDPYPSS